MVSLYINFLVKLITTVLSSVDLNSSSKSNQRIIAKVANVVFVVAVVVDVAASHCDTCRCKFPLILLLGKTVDGNWAMN